MGSRLRVARFANRFFLGEVETDDGVAADNCADVAWCFGFAFPVGS